MINEYISINKKYEDDLFNIIKKVIDEVIMETENICLNPVDSFIFINDKLVSFYKQMAIVNGIISDEIRNIIGDAIASHSGEWTTSKRSKVVLPSPQTLVQELVHTSDYIASRGDIHILFDGEDNKPKLPDINEYRLNFGKHKNQTIPEIAVEDRGWLIWAQENLTREPLLTLIKTYFEEEDEI
jgi:hypothetical protein